MVTAGNDRGATGEVLRVLVKHDRVVVQGVNLRAKHLKPSQANPNGGIIRKEMPIHMSNVSPLSDGKPTRVRFESLKGGGKARIASRDGKTLHELHAGKSEGKNKAKSK
jgi:large subunit ribosomal protein L24